MSRTGKWIVTVLAALLLGAAGPVSAAVTIPADPGMEPVPVDEFVPPSSLYEVEVSADSLGNPIVTLLGNGQMRYETLVLEDPNRLVLDLSNVVSRLETHQFPIGAGGVLRVRAGQYRTEPSLVSRVVFDLDGAVPHRIEVSEDGIVVRFGVDSDATGAIAEQAPVDLPTIPDETTQPDPATGDETPAAEPVEVAFASRTADETEAEPVGSLADADDSEAAKAEPIAESLPVGEPEAVPREAATDREQRDEASETRAVSRDALERFLQKPKLASTTQTAEVPASIAAPTAPTPTFETKKILTDATVYTGKKISLNLVDADVKQVFRLFHEISGLNFVLDPSVEGRVTVVLDNVPWDQALDLILKNNGLDKVLENNVIRIATTTKLAAEAASRKQLNEAKELEAEPITITRTLSYAKAKEVERVIREGGILTVRGKVIVDERTNTLIISDVPKKVEPLDQLISNLDAETPQVMIEARIVETSKQFVQDFGVVWGFNAVADASAGTQTGLRFPNNASVNYGLNLPGAGQASSLAFKFGDILDSFTLDIALNALETEGRGRILSSPKIVTQNNERAEIEQGVRIPVVTTTATEINVEFVSASLKLAVTPQITAEGTVILNIQVENNTPDFVNRVAEVPPINTQRAQTKVLIGDGGTAVIGGIFTVNEGMSETGVPWFRRIPVLGWLFKTKNITNENRELLIFITPKIMKLS